MKYRYLLMLALVTGLIITTSCFRKDVRTVTIHTPQIKSPECGKIVQDAFSQIEGVVSAVPNPQAGTVDVTYDAKTLAIKNIEFIIAGAGFDANDTQAPAEIRAKLPEGCR